MKYFISYRHTGADPVRLKQMQEAVQDAFGGTQNTFYSTYFNQDEFSRRGLSDAEILHHSLQKIDDYDYLMVIIDSGEKSEGMLIEVGYCIAKNIPIIVMMNASAKNHYFTSIADQVVQYNGLTELHKNINLLLLANNQLS